MAQVGPYGGAGVALALGIALLVFWGCFPARSVSPERRAQEAKTLEANQHALASTLERARSGDADAQFSLSQAYQGLWSGVPRNDAEALQWMHAAAEAGQRAAQSALGECYRNARLGVARDLVEAYKWFRIARDDSGLKLVAPQMSSVEIATAERKAREWLTSHGR